MTQLNPHRLKLAEHVRQVYIVHPEFGTPFEALLDPAYWAHVGAKLRPRDHIEVYAEDDSYYGRLLVLDCGPLYAKVHQLELHQLSNAEAPESFASKLEGHDVKWRGQTHKFCVLRGKDVLISGKASKAEAQAWLEEYARKVAIDTANADKNKAA